MKITELIEKLKEIVREHPEVDVYCLDGYRDPSEVNEVVYENNKAIILTHEN